MSMLPLAITVFINLIFFTFFHLFFYCIIHKKRHYYISINSRLGLNLCVVAASRRALHPRMWDTTRKRQSRSDTKDHARACCGRALQIHPILASNVAALGPSIASWPANLRPAVGLCKALLGVHTWATGVLHQREERFARDKGAREPFACVTLDGASEATILCFVRPSQKKTALPSPCFAREALLQETVW